MKSFTSILIGAAALASTVAAGPVNKARGEQYGKHYDWTKGGKYDETSVCVIDDANFEKLTYYGSFHHKAGLDNFFYGTKSETTDGNAFVTTELKDGYDTVIIVGDLCKEAGLFDIYIDDVAIAQADEYTNEKYDDERGEVVSIIDLKPALEKVKQLGLKKDGKKQNLILRNKSWNFRQGGFKDPLKFSLDAIVLVDSDKCDEYKDYEYKDYKGYH